uniref:Small secreted protein n=1 Tax=Bionectria ochroleuca TaxID=29856 RepID=A0A8H7NCJ6_BIOOC
MMHFTKTLLSLLPASLALASPTPRPGDSKSMRSDEPEWIIESLKRACNDADTQCDWSFRINTQDAATTIDCAFSVQGSPASHTNGALVQCGVFSVQSGYNDQVGDPFSVVSIAYEARDLIIFPSYSEAQLARRWPGRLA